MGQTESTDFDPLPPQPYHSHAHIFVLRNGAYEPQYLMPTSPNLDTLFDDGNLRNLRNFNLPDIQKTNLISNPIMMRRELLHLIKRDDEIFLEVIFDVTKNVTLSIEMLQDYNGGNVTSLDNKWIDAPIKFESINIGPGLNQQYSFNLGLEQDIANMVFGSAGPSCKENNVKGENKKIHFVSTLKVNEEDMEEVEAQTTIFYISFPRPQEETKVSPTKKSIEMENQLMAQVILQTLSMRNQKLVRTHSIDEKTEFEMEDLYGLKPEAEHDGSRECIICMTEPRDTVVLPCRHICFCTHCANIMRTQCEKCPICRQKVNSLLHFSSKAPIDTEPIRDPGKLPAANL